MVYSGFLIPIDFTGFHIIYYLWRTFNHKWLLGNGLLNTYKRHTKFGVFLMFVQKSLMEDFVKKENGGKCIGKLDLQLVLTRLKGFSP